MSSKYSCASTCIKKRAFETKDEADKEMKWLKVSKCYAKLKRSYECSFCNKWHLTKQEQLEPDVAYKVLAKRDKEKNMKFKRKRKKRREKITYE